MTDKPRSSLPAEYVPLSATTMAVGDTLEAVTFSVDHHSHDKTVRLLNDNTLDSEKMLAWATLFPSEFWGWARVFSQRFGRLNEVAVTGATWEIFRTAQPGEQLRSTSSVVSITARRGLPIATACSETYNKEGNLLLRATDDLLLIHDMSLPFYRERPREETSHSQQHPVLKRQQRVYFRYEWDPVFWLNNIHTDEFAQRCGYERGLPEFIMYMDWIWRAVVEVVPEHIKGGLQITLRRILPIYKQEVIDILVYREEYGLKVIFLRNGEMRVVAEARTL